jgi:N-acetylneuraminic acid mutarotase
VIQALNDTWAYDPTANTWSELKPAGNLPTARHGCMVYDSGVGHVIMFGGACGNLGALSDTWAYGSKP